MSYMDRLLYLPVPDIPPPQPVMQNVSSQLFLGLASAGISGLTTYYSAKAPSVTEGKGGKGGKDGGSGGDSGGGKSNQSYMMSTPVNYSGGSINYYGFT